MSCIISNYNNCKNIVHFVKHIPWIIPTVVILLCFVVLSYWPISHRSVAKHSKAQQSCKRLFREILGKESFCTNYVTWYINCNYKFTIVSCVLNNLNGIMSAYLQCLQSSCQWGSDHPVQIRCTWLCINTLMPGNVFSCTCQFHRHRRICVAKVRHWFWVSNLLELFHYTMASWWN